MDAALRALFLELFASGEPFEERVTGLPEGAVLTARLRLLVHAEWYSQAAFKQACRAGETSMSVDHLKAFIRRRACPLYLSDVLLRQHVLPKHGDGAARTVSFAMFTQCMLRVLDAIGLSPLGRWGAGATAEERNGEEIVTDIGGFTLPRRISANFFLLLRFTKVPAVTFLHVPFRPALNLHTPCHHRFSGVLLFGSHGSLWGVRPRG